MKLQVGQGCEDRYLRGYRDVSHNEIKMSVRRARDFFRKTYWWVCIYCDKYRKCD